MLDGTVQTDPPAAAPAVPAARPGSTQLYRQFADQLQRRINRLGIPMWLCDERSGLQEGYTAKLLHPDTLSGRQARWETVQLLVDAIYPDGYSIIIKPLDGARTAAKLQPVTNKVVESRVRSIMRMMGRRGGLKSWEKRKAKLLAAEAEMVEKAPRRARRRLAKKR